MAIHEETFRQIETPAYIFDIDELKKRVAMMRGILGDRIRLVYAVKANPFLIRPLIPLVDAFEVCSPGEEKICRSVGVPAGKLLLSGVNKERENFSDIMDRCGSAPVYTAESAQQAYMLNELAMEKGLKVRVLLRQCGGSQFGMDEQVLRRLVAGRKDLPGLHLEGIHFFTGTQKRPKVIAREIERADELICSLRETLPEEEKGLLESLEYGPGLAVSYFVSDTPPDDRALLTALREQLDGIRFDGTVTLEMGRFIAAYCGCYVTGVMDLKRNEGTCYCIVDGGIHQVNYFGSGMGMKTPFVRHLHMEGPGPETGAAALPSDCDRADWTVCGSLCTTSDVLARGLPLTDLKVKDRLVFERTGAYSVTEGISLFLSRDLPRVHLWENGSLKMVRDKILTEEINNGTAD